MVKSAVQTNSLAKKSRQIRARVSRVKLSGQKPWRLGVRSCRLESAEGKPSAEAQHKPSPQERVSNMERDGFGDGSEAKLIGQRGIDFAPSEDLYQTFKAAREAAHHTAGEDDSRIRILLE
jgi:hypothetical protein